MQLNADTLVAAKRLNDGEKPINFRRTNVTLSWCVKNLPAGNASLQQALNESANRLCHARAKKSYLRKYNEEKVKEAKLNDLLRKRQISLSKMMQKGLHPGYARLLINKDYGHKAIGSDLLLHRKHKSTPWQWDTMTPKRSNLRKLHRESDGSVLEAKEEHDGKTPTTFSNDPKKLYQEQRKTTKFHEKLQNMYQILCWLFNIGSKHLNSISPLTEKQIQKLRIDPFKDSTLLPDLVDQLRQTMQHKKSEFDNYSLSKAKEIFKIKSSNSQNSSLSLANDDASPTATANGLARGSHAIDATIQHDKIPPEICPPKKVIPSHWQRVLREEYIRLYEPHHGKDKMCLDLPQESKDVFRQIKAAVDRAYHGNLARFEEYRRDIYKLKLSVLWENRSMHMTEIEQLKRLRKEGIEQLQLKYKCSEALYPQWYKDLCTEASYKFCADYEKLKKIDNILQRMELFFVLPFNIEIFAKAKVCLLIQSLKAYELLDDRFQDALQYLGVRMLGCTFDELEKWMSYRKFPFVPRGNLAALI